MDPAATLKKLLDALVEATTVANADEYAREEALEALDDLAGWLKRGGFMPKVNYDAEYNSYRLPRR